MQKSIFIGIIAALLGFCACSKHSENTPLPTLKYYLNDTLVTLNSVFLTKSNYFEVSGQDSTSPTTHITANAIDFRILTDTLVAKSYQFAELLPDSTYPNITFERGWGGMGHYFNLFSNDSFTFTITRYSNGTIDGTFSGKLTGALNTKVPAIITNGQFSNIQVPK
jgi:hypothetical protein